jgi:NADH-quinone oxidoreductase subunit N
MTSSYGQLLQMAMLEVIVAITALVVLMIDVAALRNRSHAVRFGVAAGIGSLGCLLAIIQLSVTKTVLLLPDGVFVVNPLTGLLVTATLVLTIVTLLLSVHGASTEHVGEYVLLILLGTVGMMFLVSTRNLLVLFTSLELLSLSLYLLTAFDKEKPKSAEASLKYFLFGGMSAAFLLYGFSLLYGTTHSADLAQIGAAIGKSGASSLIWIALVMTAIGLGFKVAAAPFHFWAPDVYESAPNPVAAWIASGSKLASFYAFFTILTIGFAPITGRSGWGDVGRGWVPMIAGLACLSMIVGNLGALVQSSVRRLLAYSAIAHSGYMLIAVVSHTEQSLAALIYYLLTYGLATLGSFAVVAQVERETGSDQLSQFNGLSRRLPLLSACMMVFLLSQAGIPPLAGFFGKFFLFISAVNGTGANHGLLWLVVLAVAMSAVSLYYYLQVLKRIFVADPPPQSKAMHSPALTQAIVAVLALATVGLGCAPQTLIGWIAGAIQSSGH